MSCHDIGRGMNSVANVVLDLYESGQINKESASRLVLACREGVNWCDGNESETVADVVERGYCGLCFERKQDLTDIYDNDLKYPDSYKFSMHMTNQPPISICARNAEKRFLTSICRK